MTHNKMPLALVSAALTLAVSTAFLAPAQAGLMHKHPTATGIGAGLVAHHMAKHAHGGLMHRHPIMTGLAGRCGSTSHGEEALSPINAHAENSLPKDFREAVFIGGF